MGKLDPNLLLMLIAAAGGAYWYFKMGGAQTLQGLTSGGGNTASAAQAEEDVDPDPKAAKEETVAPEPEDPQAEEQWDDGKGNIYIIYVDGYMGVNGQRKWAPDHPNWDRYYRMKKYNWRFRRCMAKYRNYSWCKNKERFCSGPWKNTPWCRGFKRGDGHHSHYDPRPPVKPPRTPPRGGGGDHDDHVPSGHGGPPGHDIPQCPLSIQKNGRTYRFTRDPMPDIMPAIFPPPYVKQGNCVYKLDNNNGPGQDGRDGWDGHKGGFGISIGGDDGIKLGSFYTFSRIGNV